jgi:hypothetical protein
VCAVGGHRYTPFQPKPLHPILNAPRHLILPMAHNNHSLVLSNTTTTTQVRRAARTMPSSILAHTSSKSTSARPTSARMSRTTLCTPAGSAANGRCANSSTATTTGPRVRPKPAHDFPPGELYRQSHKIAARLRPRFAQEATHVLYRHPLRALVGLQYFC